MNRGARGRPAIACAGSHPSHLPHPSEGRITYLRATLVYVADTQNVTLSLPRDLLKRVKRVAVERDTSISALLTEALTRLAGEDRRYSAARKRALAAMRSAPSLGTGGHPAWSRDELHER